MNHAKIQQATVLMQQVVVIYPNRQIIPSQQFKEMLSLGRVQRIYLDELEEVRRHLGLEP
jgi:predicted transposase YdaD